MKNKIYERLTSLINEEGITKRELARQINVSSTIITKWTKGEKQPTADNIIALCDYFNVCADYLLGRQDWY